MIGKLLAEGIEQLRKIRFNYVDQATETASSRRITQEYIDSLTIEMRVLDSGPASTEMNLFGRTFATPVMTAALGGLKAICADPMVEVAKGTTAAGSVTWVGVGESAELQAVIETGAAAVKVIKPYKDKDMVFAKIADAEKLGAFALAMDIDFICGGKMGDNTFRADIMGPKTVADIRGFIAATKLPFVLKGILSEQDAQKALEAGAAGIVVSHHGGMVLDYAVPPLKILPRIAKLVNGKIPILVDSGITRGTDVYKALALGANGVLVGKSVIAGLAAGGADGVKQIISGTNEELRRTMQLTGCAALRDINPQLIWEI